MLRGIYTSTSGMVAQQAKLDTVANNLANADQTGFKKDTTVFKAFPDMLLKRINDDGLAIVPAGSFDRAPLVGKLGTGVEVNEVFTEFHQGGLQRTENKFDLALKGKGFFTVMTERGERYTRNGTFTLSNDGILVTHNGYPVMGENGIIRIQKENFHVGNNGEVIVKNRIPFDPRDTSALGENWIESVIVDKLKIVDFENIREIKKEGDSLYRETEYSGPPLPPETEPQILQAFLEKSNVNIVREMVDMINVQRSYEANQKSILTHDQALGKLINEVGR